MVFIEVKEKFFFLDQEQSLLLYNQDTPVLSLGNMCVDFESSLLSFEGTTMKKALEVLIIMLSLNLASAPNSEQNSNKTFVTKSKKVVI